MSISSQLIYASWSCVRPGITHTHPGHFGTKQVFARLIPTVRVAKAMYYLSDCLVLYVRKEAAISALERPLCRGGRQAHTPAEEAQVSEV